METPVIIVLISSFTTILTTLGGLFVKHLFDVKRENIKETAMFEKFEIQDKKHSADIYGLSKDVGKLTNITLQIKTAQEIVNFRNDFSIEFKKKYCLFVDDLIGEKHYNNNFLKSGIFELANIFDTILKNEFEITEKDFINEIQNSENVLRSKFAKCEHLKEFKNNINFELKLFWNNYNTEIRFQNNGDRLKSFKEATNNLAENIIKYISNQN